MSTRTAVRVTTGVLLSVAAAAALTGAVLVVVLQIGFAPVLSASMSPAFDAGDLVLTRPVAAADIEVGDVVVLPRPDADGERYSHRVIELTAPEGDTGPVVVTKGDNNAEPDAQRLEITSAEVPVVVGHVPGLGRVAVLGQHTWLRIAVIVLVGACVLLGVKRLLARR